MERRRNRLSLNMNTKKLLHRYPLLLILIAFIVASVAVSCGSNPEIDRQLTKAEDIMEQHPDSAYMLLNGIDKETLSTKKEKARYALLMSMALDKNYIDTTTFDVLQPAIDYYLDNGTPDEKLRTYYYKGRIFQNKCDEDDAINTFAKAIDNTTGAKDSLCIARTLVAQGGLYANLYDWVTYTNCYLKAAKIYKKYSYDYYEFDCLLNALNGATILKNKMLADSIYNLCSSFTPVDEYQSRNFNGHKLTYIINLGTKQDLSEIIGKQKIDSYDANGLLNLALGYNILGDNIHAKQLLDEVYESGNKIDTLKYQAILVTVLRDLGDYQKAFSTYWDYAHKQDSIYSIQFERKQRFIEEKHDLELQAQEAERQKSQIIWGSIGIVMLFCIIILSYSLYVKRIKIEHANDLVQIRNLRDNLFETGKQQEEMSNRIEKLFCTRFKLLDGLASSYFECKETGQEQKRIYADVKNSLNDFSSDTATQELTDVVNGYKNGLMEHFKSDYPKLSTSQYRLALYLFCGFSLPSISIFIGTDLRNIYVYKSRLKSIISKSDTPLKEEYLKYFA